VQVSRSLPTDTPSRDQVIQYRDVGTKLTVKPTINSDGYVSLVIQQEINAATNETQFDAPVISTREAFTQVLVKDGQTIVLGGLMDHQRDRTRHGIPVLSSIPLLGGLFGGLSSRESETELFLFVTPRIIDSDEKAAELTSERYPDELEQ
jgi:general secretion pathway protein D